MEIFLGKQLINIAYSVILGLIFGIFYDIIRIIHILCGIASYSGENVGMKRGKLAFFVFFVLDIAYMLAVTAFYSLFVYWSYSGSFRMFMLIAAILGFVIYYNTAGRVVMFFSEAVVRFLKLVFRYTVAVPIRFIWRVSSRVLSFVYGSTLGKGISALHGLIAGCRTELARKSLARDVRFDFEERDEQNEKRT